jgi:hypothetical protein
MVEKTLAELHKWTWDGMGGRISVGLWANGRGQGRFESVNSSMSSQESGLPVEGRQQRPLRPTSEISSSPVSFDIFPLKIEDGA